MNFNKKIKENFRKIANFKEDTNHLALAIGLGVWIGLSPFYGFHFFISIFVMFLFNMNKAIIISVPMIVGNPLTIVPIYVFGTALGAFFLGYQQIQITSIELSRFFTSIIKLSLPLFNSFILGNMILSIIGGVIAYFISHKLICRFRKDELSNPIS